MPAPTSAADICNIALDYFGERGDVSSIEIPEKPNEVIMARHYDLVRQSLLREYTWNFARAEATLARTGDGGLDYVDRFLLPTDCLRLISIGQWHCKIHDYNILGKEVYINRQVITPSSSSTNALQIRYIKDVTNVADMDSLFIRLFALYLAAEVAYKFSNERNQAAMLNELITRELPKAISINAQEKKPKKVERSRWIEARRWAGLQNPLTSADGTYWINVW